MAKDIDVEALLVVSAPGSRDGGEAMEAETIRVAFKSDGEEEARRILSIRAKSEQRSRREFGEKGCLVRYVMLKPIAEEPKA